MEKSAKPNKYIQANMWENISTRDLWKLFLLRYSRFNSPNSRIHIVSMGFIIWRRNYFYFHWMDIVLRMFQWKLLEDRKLLLPFAKNALEEEKDERKLNNKFYHFICIYFLHSKLFLSFYQTLWTFLIQDTLAVAKKYANKFMLHFDQ